MPMTKIARKAMDIIHPTIVANRKNSRFPFFPKYEKYPFGISFKK
jgi:hypothetical protein